MDAPEFDHLVARALDPRLVPGIYNYCDGRCPRCRFTDRCLTYLDNQELKAVDGGSLPDTMGVSVRLTLELVGAIAQRQGLDLDALRGEATVAAADDEADRHRRDPLVLRAREYGHFAWRVGRAIIPIAIARGDPGVIEAVETFEWFASMIGSKIHRAVRGQLEGWDAPDQVQSDCNGSAKIALIGIDESRRAWAVLMQAGKATADGVPAQAVRILGELDAAVRERFPRAVEFVRPGFDEPAVAADASGAATPLDPPAPEAAP
jgi:hypothetical protein